MAKATEKKTTAKKSAAAAPQKLKHLIYVGPSLADGSLRHGAVFIGDPPAHLNVEQLRDLLVPVAELPKAKRDLKDPTSPLAQEIKNFVDPTMEVK